MSALNADDLAAAVALFEFDIAEARSERDRLGEFTSPEFRARTETYLAKQQERLAHLREALTEAVGAELKGQRRA